MIIRTQDHVIPEPPQGIPEGMILEDFSTTLPNHYRSLFLFTLPDGCGVPLHPHEDDSEIYYILEGELIFIDDGNEKLCHAGDMMITDKGHSHGVSNHSGKPAKFIGIVIEA